MKDMKPYYVFAEFGGKVHPIHVVKSPEHGLCFEIDELSRALGCKSFQQFVTGFPAVHVELQNGHAFPILQLEKPWETLRTVTLATINRLFLRELPESQADELADFISRIIFLLLQEEPLEDTEADEAPCEDEAPPAPVPATDGNTDYDRRITYMMADMARQRIKRETQQLEYALLFVLASFPGLTQESRHDMANDIFNIVHRPALFRSDIRADERIDLMQRGELKLP